MASKKTGKDKQKEAKTGKERQIKTDNAAFSASSFSSWLLRVLAFLVYGKSLRDKALHNSSDF